MLPDEDSPRDVEPVDEDSSEVDVPLEASAELLVSDASVEVEVEVEVEVDEDDDDEDPPVEAASLASPPHAAIATTRTPALIPAA